MVLGYSTSYFLGDYWKDTPLYAEKIVPLLDYCLSNNYVLSNKMSSAFYELIDKYPNTSELPEENIREFVKEQGYSYILDLLNPDKENLKILVYLLVLIHQLKGSETGIQIVLSLFQLNTEPEDTVITQWYQELPVGEENTFKIDSRIDVSKAGDNFYNNFSNFIKNYVYPELKELSVRYTTTATRVDIPISRFRIKYKAIGEMSR